MNRDLPAQSSPTTVARANKPLCPMCGGVMRLSQVEMRRSQVEGRERNRGELHVLRCQCGWQQPVAHKPSYN